MLHHDRIKKCQDRTLPGWIVKEQEAIAAGKDRVFCLCKQPDTGSWYIECPFCGDWYHSTCLQLTRRELEKVERFVCPLCAQFNLPVPQTPPNLEN